MSTNASMRQLLNMVPSPARREEAGDADSWLEIELRFGVDFPADYKALINTYGSGMFVGFIWVYNPFSRTLNLESTTRRILSAYESCKITTPQYCPFAVYPEVPGLLPAACTEKGGTIFWKTNVDSKAWSIVVFDAKFISYESYAMTLVELIISLINGNVVSEIVPSECLVLGTDTIPFLPLPSKWL